MLWDSVGAMQPPLSGSPDPQNGSLFLTEFLGNKHSM